MKTRQQDLERQLRTFREMLSQNQLQIEAKQSLIATMEMTISKQKEAIEALKSEAQLLSIEQTENKNQFEQIRTTQRQQEKDYTTTKAQLLETQNKMKVMKASKGKPSMSGLNQGIGGSFKDGETTFIDIDGKPYE